LLSFTQPALTLPGYKIHTGHKPFYVKLRIFSQSTAVGFNVWYLQKFCLVPLSYAEKVWVYIVLFNSVRKVTKIVC
jgi:hypothetical protein